MRKTLLTLSIALGVTAMLVVGDKAFGGTLAAPDTGVALQVVQVVPDCVPGTNCQTIAYVVKVLCGSIGTLGAGPFRTEINVYNLADLAISPIIFQVVSTGSFATTGGTVSPNVAKTINARAAIRMECPDITGRIGNNVMGFVRIQPPAGAEISVTAVYTRTH
jgi:hypothetical protein